MRGEPVRASGEIEQVGRITKRGDAMVRALLYEAANGMITRCRADNWLKCWALGIARRRGGSPSRCIACRSARAARRYRARAEFKKGQRRR
jgi:transposase